MSKNKAEHARAEAPAPGAQAASDADVVGSQPASCTTETAPELGAPKPLTPKEIEDLTAKAAQAEQYHDQLLRTAAEFENFRKRSARERSDALRFANEGVLQKLVPVLDNFEMAMQAANAPSTTVQAMQAGIAMIHQQLKSALGEAGLEEIDAAGRTFDPNIHEAVSQEESAEVGEGTVVRQVRKGYKLRERLLRPAAVVVAKAPAGKEEAMPGGV
jgi:molecular chaperone GrpE